MALEELNLAKDWDLGGRLSACVCGPLLSFGDRVH